MKFWRVVLIARLASTFDGEFRVARIARYRAWDTNFQPAANMPAADEVGTMCGRHGRIETQEALDRLMDAEDDDAEGKWMLREAQITPPPSREPSPPLSPSITDGDLPSVGLPSSDSIDHLYARTYWEELNNRPKSRVPRGMTIAEWYVMKMEEQEDDEALVDWKLRVVEAQGNDSLRAWALSIIKMEDPSGAFEADRAKFLSDPPPSN